MESLKVDTQAKPIHPTTLTKDEIVSYRSIIETVSVTEGAEPKPGEERYRLMLAMIIMIHGEMKGRIQNESDLMELSQIEYIAFKASQESKPIKLQQLLNLLDIVLERLQPTE